MSEYIEERDDLDKVCSTSEKKQGKPGPHIVCPNGEIERVVRNFCAAKASLKASETKLSSIPQNLLRQDAIKLIANTFRDVKSKPTQVKYVCAEVKATDIDVEMGDAKTIGEVLKPACSLKVGLRKITSALSARTAEDEPLGSYDLLVDELGKEWVDNNTVKVRDVYFRMNLVPESIKGEVITALSKIARELNLPDGVLTQKKSITPKDSFLDAVRQLPSEKFEKVREIVDIPTEVRV